MLTAGALDPTFGTAGRVLTDFTIPVDLPGSDSVRQVAIQQADGKIVAAGGTLNFLVGGNAIALARYNEDGSLDTTFGDSGRVSDRFRVLPEITSMALQADGKIIVAGYSFVESTGDFFLARYNTNGTLDTTFDSDGWLTTDFGSDDLAQSVAVQPDGKIVVAGYTFQETTGTDFALARFNADGSLDAGFDGDGTVITDFGSGFNELAFSVAVQADSMIVVAGQILNDTSTDFALARYDSSGALDSGFGVGGLVTTDFGGVSDDDAFSVVLQSDGKIVVAGSSNAGGIDYDFAVARYNTDGFLDEGFDGDGKVIADLDNDHNFANSLALQSDGKIVVAGYTHNDFALARFNTDGSLDAGFDGDGKVTTDFAADDDVANSVTIQADGKIVAAGYSYQGDLTTYDFAVAQYNEDGALDSDFGTGGLVTTEFPVAFVSNRDSGRQVSIQQADGKIIVAGSSTNDFIFGADAIALARYNTDGSLDTTFGDNGQVWDNFLLFPEVTGLALQADGKIVVAGYSVSLDDFTFDFFVVRYNADGTLDSSFDGDGRLTTDFGDSNDLAAGVAVQSDGKIVVAGSSDPTLTEDYDFALARYDTTGVLDPEFGTGGLVTTDFGGTPDIVFSVALQADGKIVAAGASNQGITGSDFALARYESGGTLDDGFGTGGLVITDFGFTTDIANSMAVQLDGKIVLAGLTAQGDTGDFALARYDNSGALDATFDTDGLVTTDFDSPADWAFGVVVQSDGKIVAAGISHQGSTGFDFAVARYHANGAPDAGFGTAGQVTTDFGGPNDTAQSVALQADGKIVVAGISEQQSYDFAVARYEGIFTGAVLEPDTCDPTAMQLVVGGTMGDDKIKIHKAGKGGEVEVRLNGESLGTFSPTGRIIVNGYAGDDDVQLSGNIANAAWLYGGAGDDRLSGNDGNDVLVGGDGDDLLHGAHGRDLLIGGIGSDRLLGNSDDDILIAGTTDHDALEAALCQIMDEWSRTDADFATRVNHLKGPAGGGSAGGNNGAYFLNGNTVQDDGREDVLTGNPGADWFLFNQDGDGDPTKMDNVTGMSAFEALFAEDIDFINAA